MHRYHLCECWLLDVIGLSIADCGLLGIYNSSPNDPLITVPRAGNSLMITDKALSKWFVFCCSTWATVCKFSNDSSNASPLTYLTLFALACMEWSAFSSLFPWVMISFVNYSWSFCVASFWTLMLFDRCLMSNS